MTDNTENNHSSPLKFPSDFIIKVMGKNEAIFESTIKAIIHKHYPTVSDDQYKIRPSKDNNYTAITVSVYAESKEQLDALYKDLSDEPLILMAL